MAKLAMTKIRGFIGAVVAVVILIVFSAIVASVLEWDVPVLRDISGAIGFSNGLVCVSHVSKK